MIEDCSHWVMMERPEKLFQMVNEWLEFHKSAAKL
jgi:pimeloyl-ACP methyl ester carboxylesterase